MGDAVQANLVRRAQRGEAEAFATLIGSFERVALSIAFAITADSSLAGDVTQDAFLRAWQRLSDLKEPERFGSWLCGIVRNLSIDLSRSRSVRSGLRLQDVSFDRATAPGDGPLNELGRQEERDRLAAAIAELDEVSRSAVVLRYYENLSSKEIAELLGLTPTAIDMRLMRARRELRAKLDRQTPQVVHEGESSEGAL